MERLRAFQIIHLNDRRQSDDWAAGQHKKYGVLNPLIVQPKIEGYYEIISGHRRKYAAEKLDIRKFR